MWLGGTLKKSLKKKKINIFWLVEYDSWLFVCAKLA